ncbi:MAG TPA: hypothetical protein VIG74_06115, partial [Alphaproteobacteria bacterium]
MLAKNGLMLKILEGGVGFCAALSLSSYSLLSSLPKAGMTIVEGKASKLILNNDRKRGFHCRDSLFPLYQLM